MKRVNYCIIIVSLLLSLLFSQSISSRLLPTVSHEEDDSSLKFQEDDMAKLLGMGLMESCEENDGACLKRRMVAEAHLDYIYTQPHKPNGGQP